MFMYLGILLKGPGEHIAASGLPGVHWSVAELEEGGAGGTESMSPAEEFGDASYCCGDSSGKEEVMDHIAKKMAEFNQ
ncbi:hypothetical protein [Flavisolibacter ginsengisoli]|jgi:hypothetical protein|uniref:Uncharacterized protein n=1 Tax=Flavisolibacter ginsengisoli DSM 18119 TaxID=1121884 RepID=A0A1M4WY25_9BACT|nr:hypothetical protein [Flavisolibacter ginsengisoli]SHE86146.1 hypothetical protein SAMN02745131_01266 [Flavisolibacter ginsengisoli DSM 18119]